MESTQSTAVGPGRAARITRVVVLVVSWLCALVSLATVVAVVLVVCDVPVDGRPNIGMWDKFVYAVGAAWTLGFTGVAWLVVALVSWRVRSARSRALWIAPSVVVVGALAAVAALVLAPGVDDSRSEMDALAADALTRPAGWYERYYDAPRKVGAVEVDEVVHRPDGTVLVEDADGAGIFVVTGWVYSPDGPPSFDPKPRELEVTHRDGPWWDFSYSMD